MELEMKSLLSCLALSLVLSGCGMVTENPTDPTSPDDPNLPSKPTIVTDLSVCNRGLPTGTVRGRWRADMKRGDWDIRMIVQFDGSNMSVTNTCIFRGSEVSASVSSRYFDNGSNVDIYRTDSRTNSASVNGARLQCTASIESGMVRYWSTGPCLNLQAQGKDLLTLIPTL